MREELRNIIQTLLHYQYVECKTMGTIYQVTRGSGMGSNSSADIADIMFKVLAEDDWAACPAIKHRHGVKAYFRYRDDIFILIRLDSLALAGFIKKRAWLGRLKAHTSSRLNRCASVHAHILMLNCASTMVVWVTEPTSNRHSNSARCIRAARMLQECIGGRWRRC